MSASVSVEVVSIIAYIYNFSLQEYQPGDK